MNPKEWILLIGLIVLGVLLIAVLLVVKRKKKAPAPDPVIVAGLQSNALRFMGLYEGIYAAVHQGTSDGAEAYREWHIRAENLDPAFQQAFAARFPGTEPQISHLRELLDSVEAAGICRSEETLHTADAMTEKRYIYFGSDTLQPGKAYQVLKPCWTQNNIIVEQGILVPKEGQ